MATITTDAQLANLAVIEINRIRAKGDKIPDDSRDEALYYVEQGRIFLSKHFSYDPTASTGDAPELVGRAIIEYAKAHLQGQDPMLYPPFLSSAQMWAQAAAVEVYEAKIAALAAS